VLHPAQSQRFPIMSCLFRQSIKSTRVSQPNRNGCKHAQSNIGLKHNNIPLHLPAAMFFLIHRHGLVLSRSLGMRAVTVSPLINHRVFGLRECKSPNEMDGPCYLHPLHSSTPFSTTPSSSPMCSFQITGPVSHGAFGLRECTSPVEMDGP
jgi:hypothetical protein